jgi:hypothetical protein
MMRRIAMSTKYTWVVSFVVGLCSAAAVAQPPPAPTPPETPDTLFFLQNVAPLPVFGGQIDIIRSEGGVPGPVVEGKPYSARSITESTQTLADGNRITQRNEAVIHRDTEGRTRREETLGGVGAWQAGEPVTTINIHDPVSGKSYVLDPAQRTAREIRPFQVAVARAGEPIEVARAGVGAAWSIAAPVPPPVPGVGVGVGGAVAVDVDRDVTVIRRREGGRENVRVFHSGAGEALVAGFPPGTTGMYEQPEDLGEQVLEGLLVKGTRMTDTIPAGTIGNERPIEIVTERWYSADIDATVLQRFSDPRFGETVYRLVNVVRGEPSPDLFEVPQGYEIVAPEMPRAGVRVAAPPGAPREVVQFELQRTESAPAQ